MNMSQDQERRLEEELSEEKKKRREAVTAAEGGNGEEEGRLRELLAEAEVRERRRRVNLTSPGAASGPCGAGK